MADFLVDYQAEYFILILKRYLYKEILQNFLAIFLVLILIVISLRFVRYLGDVAAGKMTIEIIYQMLTLKLISSMTLIIPLCLYLSLFMALGRLQRDNELVSITTAGLGNRFYFSTILKLTAVFALLSLLLTLLVIPWAEKNIDFLKQKANQESDISGISAGSFKEFSSGNRVLYVEDVNKKTNRMENVFLQVTEQGSTGVLTSDSASIQTDETTGERTVIFFDGKRYVGKPDQLDYSITEFHRYSVRLEQHGYNTANRTSSRIPTRELIESLKLDPPGYSASSTELQWRFSIPVSLLLLSAFAILIVRSSKGSNGTLLFISAILIFFVYNNLMNISHDLVNREKISTFPGLWWPHILLFTIILIILFIPNFLQYLPKNKRNLNENS